MLNRTVHGYLPAFQDHLRTSVLGRAAGRTMRRLAKAPPHADGEDDDEAPRSAATDAHIRTFFDAWREGDEDGQKSALGKVVESWRADNAAGGVPVHGHLPLPRIVRDVLGQHTRPGEGGESKSAIPEVIARLEPGVRALVSQQLQSVLPRPADPRGDSNSFPWLADVFAPNGDSGQHMVPAGHSTQRLQTDADVDAAKASGMMIDREAGDAARLFDNGTELLSASHPKSRGQQPPNRLTTKILSSNNEGGRINSQRNFELDQPSKRGGYIIQEVTIIFRERLRDGSLGPPRVLYHFWEAWEVRAGQRTPSERRGAANDSVRFERGPGRGGRVEILTRTVFYEGLQSLPPSFRRNPKAGQPGYDPTIDPAGGLQATSRPFQLPRGSYDSVTNADNNAIYTDW